jgi:hypothetical protein
LKNPTHSQALRRPRLTTEQKQAIRNHFYSLCDQWCEMTWDKEAVNSDRFYALQCEMYQLRQQYPWLNKAAA